MSVGYGQESNVNIHDQMFDGGPKRVKVDTYHDRRYRELSYVKEGCLWKLCWNDTGSHEQTLVSFTEGTDTLHLRPAIRYYVSPIIERPELEKALCVGIETDRRYPVHYKRFYFHNDDKITYPLVPGVVIKRGSHVLKAPKDWVIRKLRTRRHQERYRQLYQLVLSYLPMFDDLPFNGIMAHPCMESYNDGLIAGSRSWPWYQRPDAAEICDVLIGSHQKELSRQISDVRDRRVSSRLNWLGMSCLAYMEWLHHQSADTIHNIAQRIAVMSRVTIHTTNPDTVRQLYVGIVTNSVYVKERDAINKLGRFSSATRTGKHKTQTLGKNEKEANTGRQSAAVS